MIKLIIIIILITILIGTAGYNSFDCEYTIEISKYWNEYGYPANASMSVHYARQVLFCNTLGKCSLQYIKGVI